MSSDDGWVIRNDKQGLFVLQHYSASADEFPDVEASGYRYSTLEKATLKYAELDNGDYPSEYGLTVQIEQKVKPVMETVKYVRKTFYVDAVQITAENMEDVAKWCQGEVRVDEDGKNYIHVRVHRPLNERQTKAYVGDWVLYAGTGYKVYTTKAFSSSFDLVEDQEEVRNVFEQDNGPVQVL